MEQKEQIEVQMSGQPATEEDVMQSWTKMTKENFCPGGEEPSRAGSGNGLLNSG